MSWSVYQTGRAGEVRTKLAEGYAAAAGNGMPAQEAHVVQYAGRVVEACVALLPEELEIKVESSGSCSLDADGKVMSCSLSIKVEPGA